MPVTSQPHINHGKPSIRSIAVQDIISRFLGGDAAYAISEDYGIWRDEVEEALRFALRSYACKYGTDTIDSVSVSDAEFRADCEHRLYVLEDQVSEIRAIIERLEGGTCSGKS